MYVITPFVIERKCLYLFISLQCLQSNVFMFWQVENEDTAILLILSIFKWCFKGMATQNISVQTLARSFQSKFYLIVVSLMQLKSFKNSDKSCKYRT